MIRRYLMCVVIVFSYVDKSASFPWPGMRKGTITSTLGEYRPIPGEGGSIRFHNGADISGNHYTNGANVYSVFDGYCQRWGTREIYITDKRDGNSRQSASYVHVNQICRNGDPVTGLLWEDMGPPPPPTLIGTIHGNHLHFILGPGHAGDTEPGSYNALAPGQLDDYKDLAEPMVVADSIVFCKERISSDSFPEDCSVEFTPYENNKIAVRGRVDAKIRAQGFYTLPNGSSGGNRTGVYGIGYKIEDPRTQQVIYDRIESVFFVVNPDASGVGFVYPEGSGSGPIVHWVTNKTSDDGFRVLDGSWNTKQRCEGCNDAISNSESQFPDGRYKFYGCVSDINPSEDHTVCAEKEVIVDNFKPQIKEFEVLGAGGGPEDVAGIGDVVTVRIRFDQEMDTSWTPELRTADGVQSLGRVNGRWENGPGGVPDTFVADVELSELDSQQFLRLELMVSGAKGLGPAERDVSDELTTLDDGQTPLVLWADLVRPVPAVAGDEKPGTVCGELRVALDVRDEPEYYRPGEPIEPAARFESITFHLEAQAGAGWTPLETRDVTAPDEVVTRSSGWQPDAVHRYWLVARDRAGNLDLVSLEESGARQTAEQFMVRDCRTTEDDSNNCLSRYCEEKKCKIEDWCTASSVGCSSCSCNGHGVCECDSGGCHGGEQENPDQPPDHNPDIADENDFFTNDLPRWADVRNEDPASGVGVLAAASYPAVFGLLAEFGQGARLVPRRFSPQEVTGLELLVVPSGALRNQGGTELAEALAGYVEAGGNLLVFAQAYGADWAAVPGGPEGYGWREDRSCYSASVWYDEDAMGHPVFSGGLGNPVTAAIDGHFLALPEGARGKDT